MRKPKCQCLITLLGILAANSTYATSTAPSNTMSVYRCTDDKGKVSLQDTPCADSNSQEITQMIRPKDAPPLPAVIKPLAPIAEPAPIIQVATPRIPAPDLFRCTDFDGKVRDSEYYDPKPRCVPLWALGYHTNSVACSWVEDSCVRYQGKALCERWKEKQKQAKSDEWMSAGGSPAYLKSELLRITQIVETSCSW